MYEIYWILNSVMWFGAGWYCCWYRINPKKKTESKYCRCRVPNDLLYTGYCSDCKSEIKYK